MNKVGKSLNPQEAYDFLNQRKTTYNADYKLDYVISLFKELKIYSPPCKVIHVTGTNGKGSTCSMLESVYRIAGLKTGIFTSPYLISEFESIKVSNQNITEDQFIRLFNKVFQITNIIEAKNQSYKFSFFEFQTAIAILFFVESKVDVIILEVGMGGRLDATNALQSTTCSVFTTISFDHQNILGNSLEEIAREKSGIIKYDSLVFLGFGIKDEPKNIISKISSQNRCNIYQPASIETFFNDQTPDYQNYNATTTKLVVQTLSQEGIISIPSESIEQGIRKFYWPARWQKYIYENKIIYFDGAHNEEGALAISHQINRLNKKPILIFGSNKEARATKMLKILLPICKKMLISKSTHERSLPASKIYSCIESQYQDDKYVEFIDLNNIPSWIQKSDEQIIVITGSLYLIGDIMKLLCIKI